MLRGPCQGLLVAVGRWVGREVWVLVGGGRMRNCTGSFKGGDSADAWRQGEDGSGGGGKGVLQKLFVGVVSFVRV